MDENTAENTPFERCRWLPFLLPFIIYMVATQFEPARGDNQAVFAKMYALVYVGKIAATLAALACVWRGFRQFPFHISRMAVVVGLIGGPLWIGLCSLNVEHAYLAPLLNNIGLGCCITERPAFNPFDPAYGFSPTVARMFLAVRFLGLALIVPIIEEMFLRGFFMRFVMERDWWKVPFGKVTPLAVAVGTLLPVMYHPEWLAAAVWFSMITWLMTRTRNIWDCIAAHALTNLIMGVYAVWYGGEAWLLL
jgi:uncharacterized protein